MVPEPMTLLLLFFVALALLAGFFWPERGLLARWNDRKIMRQRQEIEDALKYIFNLQLENQPPSLDELAGALHHSEQAVLRLVVQMQAQDLLEQHGRRLYLTPAGQRWALQVVRAHRLWERYLADEARVPLDQIHTMAHKLEHNSTRQQINELDASLGHPSQDPHGDPIPDAAGQMRQTQDSGGEWTQLTDLRIGECGRVVHLEDEPPVAYAQLLAEGLQVGQRLSVLERTNERVTLTNGLRELNIAPAIASNVYLHRQEVLETQAKNVLPLSELKRRSSARVVSLDERCQGFTRRRFLDLGLTPGTLVYPELENSFREPRAYRVRGTLIALRNDQASMILVQPEEDFSSHQ